MAAIREKAKKFQRFVKGLKGKYGNALPEANKPLLDQFIFYLLFYSNPVTYAKKAYKSLTDDKQFASWSEVRVSTVREIADLLNDAKVKPAEFLAPRLKLFLQKVFEEVDDMALEPLLEQIEELETARQKKDKTEEVRKFIEGVVALPHNELPPWGAGYLLTGLGLDTALPWDPHTEAVLEAQKVFPAKSTLVQKKRVAKALMDGFDMHPLEVHHLIVEYAKRDLKRK